MTENIQTITKIAVCCAALVMGKISMAQTVVLAEPSPGASFTEGASIPIIAEVTGANAKEVSFFNGASFIGTKAGTPYKISWDDVPSGTHTLSAMATLPNGDRVTSPAQDVLVKRRAALGQWNLNGAPEGQAVKDVAYVNGTVFAQHQDQYERDSHIYRSESTNNGSEWDTSGFSIPSGYVSARSRPIIIGNKIFVKFYDGGSVGYTNKIFYSEDKGRTWKETAGPNGYCSSYSLFYWSGTLLSSDEYIYDISTNTWSKVPTFTVTNDNLPRQLERFAKAGQNLIAADTRDDYLYYSQDNGTSWKTVSPKVGAQSVYVFKNTVFIVSEENPALYTSTDNGVSYSRVNTTIKGGTFEEIDGKLYCIDIKNNAIYHISDDGRTATKLNENIPVQVYDLAGSNNYLFAATNMGIYRSSNKGTSWDLANKGLGYQQIIKMISANDRGDTLYCITKNGIWRSLSYGLRWISLGLVGKGLYDIAVCNGKVYATAEDKIYHTANQGNSWQEIDVTLQSTLIVYKNTVYFNNFEALFQISGSSVVRKVDDPGRCWVVGDYIYSDKAKRTSDLVSWTTLSGIANPEEITGGFTSNGTYTYAAMEYGRFEPRNAEVYRSENGISYTAFDNGLSKTVGSGGSCWLISICARNDSVYAINACGGDPAQMKYTTSTSSRWSNFANVPSQKGIGRFTNLIATNTSLYHGAYRYDFEQVPDVPDYVDTNNYVDPGSNNINLNNHKYSGISQARVIRKSPRVSYIQFISGNASVTRVSLFTMRGRRVWSESRKTPSNSSMQFMLPTESLGAGMYLVRIVTQGYQKNIPFAIYR